MLVDVLLHGIAPIDTLTEGLPIRGRRRAGQSASGNALPGNRELAGRRYMACRAFDLDKIRMSCSQFRAGQDTSSNKVVKTLSRHVGAAFSLINQ
jgi:hypothetical protein